MLLHYSARDALRLCPFSLADFPSFTALTEPGLLAQLGREELSHARHGFRLWIVRYESQSQRVHRVAWSLDSQHPLMQHACGLGRSGMAVDGRNGILSCERRTADDACDVVRRPILGLLESKR